LFPVKQTDGGAEMKFKTLFVLAFVLLLIGCGIEVPVDRQAYVGEWKGLGVSLLITSDGTVSYERKKGNVSTSINAPLQEFQGDNFVVGIAFMDTVFEVSKPPYQENDQWKMVVDGVELTRVF